MLSQVVAISLEPLHVPAFHFTAANEIGKLELELELAVEDEVGIEAGAGAGVGVAVVVAGAGIVNASLNRKMHAKNLRHCQHRQRQSQRY